jgi:hypothetical protein
LDADGKRCAAAGKVRDSPPLHLPCNFHADVIYTSINMSYSTPLRFFWSVYWQQYCRLAGRVAIISA